MRDLIIKGLQFEGRPLTAVTVGGVPHIVIKELGAMLEYGGDGTHLTDLIRGPWRREFVDGTHFLKVEGQDLVDLKRLTDSDSASRIGQRARSVILLTEAGVNLVLLKTEKPIGVALRRYLAETIMPALARGEGIPPRGEPEPPKGRSQANIRALREQRLLAQMQVKVIEAEAVRALARGLPAGIVDAWRTTQLEKATGIPMQPLLPVEDQKWFTLREVAEQIGVEYGEGGYEPGAIISLVPGFEKRKNIDGLMRGMMNHVKKGTRSCTTHQYTAAAIEKIRPYVEVYRIEQAKKAEAAAALEAERAERREARATAKAEKERVRAAKREAKARGPGAPVPPEQQTLGLEVGGKKDGAA